MVRSLWEVTALANEKFIRGSNIIVFNRKKQASYWDSSIQFENCEQQPKLVNEEKQKYIIKQKNTIQENLILQILSNGVTGEK